MSNVRDRIIYAVLTENFNPEMRQLWEESPKKFEVSDLEIKTFMIDMSRSELATLRSGRLGPTFMKNVQAAMDRINAKKPKRPANGRIASRGLSFGEDQVSKVVEPLVNPDEETPAQRGNREARALPKVSTISKISKS